MNPKRYHANKIADIRTKIFFNLDRVKKSICTLFILHPLPGCQIKLNSIAVHQRSLHVPAFNKFVIDPDCDDLYYIDQFIEGNGQSLQQRCQLRRRSGVR